ncbi:MAG: exodeoxyribonuclease V subunit beta [Desulfosudaceae bacterium]
MSGYTEMDIPAVPLEGATLIEASAGTGKTYTIAALVLRLLLEAEIDIRNLLVVTFTEAATSELRDRIWRNLSQTLAFVRDPATEVEAVVERLLEGITDKNRAAGKLQQALICFDEASVFTIHGFCKRVLSRHAFESSLRFDAELITDQEHYVREVIDDFQRLTFSRATRLECAAAAAGRLDLENLARTFINKPTLVLVPEKSDESRPALARAYDAVQAAWHAGSGEVREILYGDNRFSRGKNSFRSDILDNHLALLATMFEGQPDASGLKLLDLFTPAGLLNNMKPSRRGEGAPEHDFFVACESLAGARRDFLTEIKHNFKDYLETELSGRKKAGRVQYFSDLLTDLRQALATDPDGPLEKAIRDQYQAVLIDEFQDTDPVQYDIFHRLFVREGRRLFLIGDPKQSIYAFRSADIFSYLEAAERVPDSRRLTLPENWRSESALVRAVNHLFTTTTNPFILGESIPFTRVRAAAQSSGNRNRLTLDGAAASGLELWLAGPEDDKDYLSKADARALAAAAVTNEIADLLEQSRQGRARIGDRPLEPSDMAVLVTRNQDAALIKERLADLRIPAVVSGTGNVFQTGEARELEQVLRAAVSPGHTRRLNTALAADLVGLSAADLRTLLEDESGAAAYEEHLERFAGYHELWRQGGFIRVFRRFLSDYAVRERLLGMPHGERRLTNLLHLSELIHRVAQEQRLDMNGVLNWLIERQEEGGGEEEESQLRLERDGQAVQILTVWKSKGLQYPIVFCPFMWQQGALSRRGEDIMFHRDNRVFLDIGSDRPEHVRAAARERLAELMRLLYVAVTRAVNRCCLVCGRIGKKPEATALDYLLAGGSEPGQAVVEDINELVSAETAKSLAEAVEERVAPAGADIRVRSCRDIPSRPPLAGPGQSPSGLRPAVFGGHIDQGWSVSSFTRLVSGRPEASVDEDLEEQGSEAVSDTGPPSDPPEEPTGIHAFPAGPVPGLSIHFIFEQLDFTRDDAKNTRRLVQAALRRYGLEKRRTADGTWTGVVSRMVERVRRAPLLPGHPEFRLEMVPPERMIAEMGFYYPVNYLTVNDLIAVFKRAGAAGEVRVPDYFDRLGRLNFNPAHGYMRGFIDLIFCFDNKYYLLDWKTNHLGNSGSCYGPERLTRVMSEHHYCLQYYIYTLALHRYLAARLPDYDYQTHFGGVFYLFVRGVRQDRPGQGIYFDRPARSLIEALDGVLG